MEQRKVGRPPKGVAEVGKAGLVKSARRELQSRRYDVFQRKDLASACGVTPALITYYFKDSDEIFCSIVSEVVERYYNDLRSIVRSNAGQVHRYKAAVNLLVEAFKKDGNIFDIFEHAVATGRCKSPDFISMAKEELKILCHDSFPIGLPDAFDRSVFYGAVWGMCEAAAKFQHSGIAEPDGPQGSAVAGEEMGATSGDVAERTDPAGFSIATGSATEHVRNDF